MWKLFLAISLLASPIVQESKQAYEPTSAYEVRQIEGWKVLVHKRLTAEKPAVEREAMRLLDQQLHQIVRVVPEKPLAELRKIPIWIEYFHPRHPCACYHEDAGWLKENGFNPEKVKCVEIANPENFIEWLKSQPWMVLHELAHGYHDRVLGNQEPRVLAAYRKMKDSGKYDSVLRYSGRTERHYGLNNQMEYFAEATEAFFGVNDYFPFVRAEQKQVDPEIDKILVEIWGEPVGIRRN
jgi:hypothetical protein